MKSFSLERLPEGDIRTAPGPGDGRGARRGGATADGGHARFVSGSPHWFSLLAMLFLGFAAVSQVAAGTWTPLGNRAPDNIDTMLLLTDGTVMALSGEPASGAIGNAVYKLTPDIHGSYVNGTWSTLASMHDTRLYYSSAVLVDGRVFVAGGEYGTGGSNGEVYDPVADTWTPVPNSGQFFSDSGCVILPSGNVLVAPVFPTPFGSTILYDPNLNTWLPSVQLVRGSDQDEASWVKLPDNSIITIDPFGVNSERYIPSLNSWVDDSTVPVPIYDPFLFEMGPAFLLPNGKAFYFGDAGNTALYTPSGTTSPGTWSAGPAIPNGWGAPDTPGAMMANGQILYAVSPAPTTNQFTTPTGFLIYDPVANGFTVVNGPRGATLPGPSFVCRMLDLPDGTVLFSTSARQLFVYQPSGIPLAAGKPTVNSITANSDGSYHLIGELLNGISQGAAYGDDAQMDSNYPIVRMTDASGRVFYGRTFNRSSTSVMTGSTPESTDFTVPPGLQVSALSLVVVANGISSDPVSFSPNAAPDLVILTNTLSGGNGNGVIDPDECNNLDITLTNTGSTGATGLQATLSTSTAGVIIAQPTVAYPDIPTNGIGADLSSFKVSTTPLFICGTPVQFTLVLKSDEGISSSSFVLSSGVPGSPVRFDNNTVVPIPDNNPLGTNSTVVVSNITSALNHVRVALTIAHPLDSDLALELIGPDGTTVALSKNNGGNGQSYGTDCLSDADRTIFDDNGSTLIQNGSAPFLGVFQPQEPLSAFVGKSGTNINGSWQLHVVDGVPQNVGTIQCWSLILTPTACVDGGGQCPGADIAVGVQTLVDTVIQGNTLTYNITVTNLGPDTASAVAVNQTLPPSVIFVSANGSQGSVTHSSAGVSANMGAVPAGATATLSVVVIPTQVGTLFSTVSAGSVEPDPNTANNSVTISTRVVAPSADLAISLSALPNPALLGGLLTYTIGVTNNGPSSASAVVVTNLLPLGVTFVSAGPSQGGVTDSGSTVVWSVGSLPVGSSASATVVAGISSAVALGAITDTATVSSALLDPLPGNNTATAVTVVGPAADLALTMTVAPISAVIYGSNITYSLTVQNLGPSIATNVNLTDTLPPNATFLSSVPSAGVAVTGNFLTWGLAGNLGVGSSTNLTIVVSTTNVPSASLPANLTNSAIVSATAADPNPANNTASVVTLVDHPTNHVVAAGAKLVTQTADGAIDPGATVAVQLGLQNVGNIDGGAVVATLLATNGVTSPSGPANYGALHAGGLPVSEPFTFTASGTNGGVIIATLQLVAGGTSNLPSVTFTFPLPSLARFYNLSNIVIPNPPGTPLSGMGPASPYPSTITVAGLTNVTGKVTVTITNFSHTFSDDVAILLVGPASGPLQSTVLMSHVGGSSGATDASIAFDDAAASELAQSSQITSGTYKPSAYGTVNWPTNTPAGPYGSALSTFIGTNPNGSWSLYVYDGSAGDTGQIVGGWSLGITTVQPVNQIVDLSLGGAATPNPALAGAQLTYTFTVTNNGPGVASSGAAFTNVLPAGATFVSASSSLGIAATNTSGAVYCVFTNGLAVGAQASVSVVLIPNPGVANLTNQATISGQDTDLNTNNNLAIVVTPVTQPVADLALTLANVPASVVVGSNLTYEIAVTNLGPQTAYSVMVTNPLPPGVTFVPGLSGSTLGTLTFGGGTISCNLGSMVSGQGALVTVTEGAQQVGSITNSAGVSTLSNDPDTTNNFASAVTVAAVAAPHILAGGALMVPGGNAPFSRSLIPGQAVAVSFSLTNAGTADTANLMATLQSSGGITPGGSNPQTYGHLVHAGAAISENFTFTPVGGNGAQVTATLQLNDGAANLGSVTFTFNLPATNSYANGAAITIPDHGPGSPYPSTISVAGDNGLVSKVTVTLSNLTHAFPSDIGVLLVAPSGQATELMAVDGGPYAITNVTLTFDDAASAMLPASSQIVAGTYLPSGYTSTYPFQSPAPAGPYSNALAVFDGAAPNGTWSLYVFDDSPGDSGIVNSGWSLALATVSPLNPVADLGVSVANPAGTVGATNNFSYSLTVTNNGPSAATGVVLTDVLPVGMSFVSSVPSGSQAGAGNPVTVNLGGLAAGASAGVTLTVLAGPAGTYTNRASVSANEADLNQANNQAQVVTVVQNLVPAILSGAANRANNTFALTLTGQGGAIYAIETSSDLTNWTSVVVSVLPPNGRFVFTDTNVVSTPRRFYRAVLQVPP